MLDRIPLRPKIDFFRRCQDRRRGLLVDRTDDLVGRGCEKVIELELALGLDQIAGQRNLKLLKTTCAEQLAETDRAALLASAFLGTSVTDICTSSAAFSMMKSAARRAVGERSLRSCGCDRSHDADPDRWFCLDWSHACSPGLPTVNVDAVASSARLQVAAPGERAGAESRNLTQ